MISKCSLVLFFLISSTVLGNDDYKEINLKQGPVRGYKDGGNHYVFYGIPYATAPKGEDKFKAPLPAPKWSTTLNAVKKDIICPQHDLLKMFTQRNDYDMTEDCLIANVYVPDTQKENLPVLVVVHGGAYQIGYGELIYSGAVVDIGEIVVVTFNYRVGIHGFLCLGTEKAPGNAGMKDMVALLKWVQNNIADFNGNPDDVTITGYSAGSSAVEHLILSKMSNKLFKKAIADSGNALSSWGVSIDPVDTAKKLAKSKGVDSEDLREIERYFTTTSIFELKSNMVFDLPNTTFEYVPCIEKDIGQEMFLSDSPMKILKSGDFPKIPLLIGHAKHEGLIRANLFDVWKDRMDESFSDFLPADLIFSSKDEKEQVAQKIKTAYFGNTKVKDNSNEYINYFSDVMFKYANYRSVNLQVEAGNKNIYFYEYQFFEESALSSFEQIPSMDIKGPGHCAQTYMFYGDKVNGHKFPENVKKLQSELRKMWINFIKTGRPASDDTIEWPAVSTKGTPFMVLDRSSNLKHTSMLEREKLWDEVYAKYYRHPVPPKDIVKDTIKQEL